MIPKLIHYCWLSNDPIPQRLQQCIDTWRPLLPDYEIRLWTLDVLGEGINDWVKEAFALKKYAFAADYIRAYALYHYGGIYLDSDVELLKSFDHFLHLPYMMCHESGTHTIEAACVGTEPNHPFFKALLEYYDGKHFIKDNSGLEDTPMPYIFIETARGLSLKIKDIEHTDDFDYNNDTLSILPSSYFSPINLTNMDMEIKPHTVAIHHFAASWRSKSHRTKKKFQRFIGPRLTQMCSRLKYRINSLLTSDNL